jgi:hypothetical protein
MLSGILTTPENKPGHHSLHRCNRRYFPRLIEKTVIDHGISLPFIVTAAGRDRILMQREDAPQYSAKNPDARFSSDRRP